MQTPISTRAAPVHQPPAWRLTWSLNWFKPPAKPPSAWRTASVISSALAGGGICVNVLAATVVFLAAVVTLAELSATSCAAERLARKSALANNVNCTVVLSGVPWANV